MEKSAVYDEDLHASLLGFDSLITKASRIFVPNYAVSDKIQGKTDFQRKNNFFTFLSEIEERFFEQSCRVDQALS